MLFTRRSDLRPDGFSGGNGRPDDELAQDLGVLAGEIRAAYAMPPDPQAESRHVAAIAAAATELADAELAGAVPVPAGRSAGPARRAPARSRLRTRLALAAAGAAALLGTLGAGGAGLALAGVVLPDPARDAFELLGITLPNQRADDVQRAIRDGNPRQGCEFGRAVASAANAGTPGAARSKGWCPPSPAADARESGPRRPSAGDPARAARRSATDAPAPDGSSPGGGASSAGGSFDAPEGPRPTAPSHGAGAPQRRSAPPGTGQQRDPAQAPQDARSRAQPNEDPAVAPGPSGNSVEPPDGATAVPVTASGEQGSAPGP